ncbi:hypothetical protein [Pyxidicoccus xibeiensis]|uniref:hypothetical protein n=1 Tax=Pyxidicoccus xibeiensis TaxID=2906759 RepID=UPI0020A6FE7F|nr:hypothetical protein [Pyxidicoccus xibeiensis]MCP3140232.1 hypothetical protein [Pyxidicoccus xibeiensis]
MRQQSIRDAFELHRWRLRSPALAAGVLDRPEEEPRASASDSLCFEALAPDTHRGLRWAADRDEEVRLAYERWCASLPLSAWPSSLAPISLRELLESDLAQELGRFKSPFPAEEMSLEALLESGHFDRGPALTDGSPVYMPYDSVLRLFAELAPHIEDLRLMSTQRAWTDELWVVEGSFYWMRHPTDSADAAAYFQALLAEVPEDDALRSYVIHEWWGRASVCLEHCERNQGLRATLTKRFGERASQLHDLDTPRARARKLLEAQHAIERARTLGADTEPLQRRLAELAAGALPPVTADALGRYDALAAHAGALLARGAYLQALRVVERAAAVEPDWYEGSQLLRALALEGLGRQRGAVAAYRLHIEALRDEAPHELKLDADRLLSQSRSGPAELIYRALFDAPFFLGVAARVGAATCRAVAGDVQDARGLYAAALEEAVRARERHPDSGVTRELERYERIAQRKLTGLDG